MATGDGNLQIHLPPNVWSFNPAPQLALLSRASAFITHGGINSIKESIHAEVPMIVYPRDPRQDQYGNAARVVFNQLGLLGDIRKDSASDISSKITQLMLNPSYRRRVHEFKVIDCGYTDERFKELFDRIKPLD
jgi:UDP:flavonoid glycosyltransferase YjiC (YdhE family)